MGTKTHAQMVTELQRRVSQLPSADAGEAINRSIRWINRQGSYSFQVADPTTLVVANNGVTAQPATMDVGKAHVIYNPNGHPVRKFGIQDAWMTGNYNTLAGIGYDSYIITQSKLVFYPAINPGLTVTIIYHSITTDISGAQTSNLPRDFDDLIIDLAEAEERRIWDVGDNWPQLLARAVDQIKVLLNGYVSVSLEPMPLTEAQQVTIEKTQVGRA